MEYKRFKSPDNSVRRVALLSGHVFLIDGEWSPIPEYAWKASYAEGAISEDMIRNLTADNMDVEALNRINTVADRNEQIRSKIKEWVANNELDHFTSNGKPKATDLTEALGFRVTNADRDTVWFKLVESGYDPSRTGSTSA